MKIYIHTVNSILSIIGVLHLLRIFYEWPVEIGGVQIPLWASWIALIGAGLLASYGWRLAKNFGVDH